MDYAFKHISALYTGCLLINAITVIALYFCFITKLIKGKEKLYAKSISG
jgi:hypothetical protein